VGHERKALEEERTGAAKTSVASKKEKEIYKERRIAVFLGGLDVMRVSAALRASQSFLYTESVFFGEPHGSHSKGQQPHDQLTPRHHVSPSSPFGSAFPTLEDIDAAVVLQEHWSNECDFAVTLVI
jgi:hypothetical protein